MTTTCDLRWKGESSADDRPFGWGRWITIQPAAFKISLALPPPSAVGTRRAFEFAACTLHRPRSA